MLRCDCQRTWTKRAHAAVQHASHCCPVSQFDVGDHPDPASWWRRRGEGRCGCDGERRRASWAEVGTAWEKVAPRAWVAARPGSGAVNGAAPTVPLRARARPPLPAGPRPTPSPRRPTCISPSHSPLSKHHMKCAILKTSLYRVGNRLVRVEKGAAEDRLPAVCRHRLALLGGRRRPLVLDFAARASPALLHGLPAHPSSPASETKANRATARTTTRRTIAGSPL